MNTQTRIVNGLTAVVTLLTLSIGAGAFVISYDALYAIGLGNGIPAAKAWIWPLLIDAPLVVFTLALLVSQILRHAAKLWAGLVILYTLATIGFNLSHAQPTPLGWTVAIVAPIGLLLTTEALRHLAKTIIERQAVVESLADLAAKVDARQREVDTLAAQVDTLNVKRDELQAEIDALQVDAGVSNIVESDTKFNTLLDAKQAKRQERLDTLRGYLLDNPQANLTEAAAVVKVSRQTAGEYVKELGLHKNGNGWEAVR
jgi:outer membrane murein-binding lipoprotein Lpp